MRIPRGAACQTASRSLLDLEMASSKTLVDEVSAAPPHLLVVDDSPVDRAVISGILRSSNFRVTAVDSGKKALELLASEANVGMIFTDYSMPEMTGYELLNKVKGSSKLREIPVVIMSSENVPARISRCLEEGAEDFLLKPVQRPMCRASAAASSAEHCVLRLHRQTLLHGVWILLGIN